METLYRKVTFEINDKNHDKIWLIGKSANFIFNPNTRNGEELSDFLAGCEEVPDNTSQLKADKAELLELMTEMKESFDHKAWVTGMELKSFSSRIESLIQKMKQCQENTPR